MPAKIIAPLPPLRRRIRKNFFILIGLYAVLGIFMMASIFLSSGITPKMIHVNYDSIVSVREMQEAWNALQNPSAYTQKTTQSWIKQFDEAISFEEKNITEVGEDAAFKKILELWNQSKQKNISSDLLTYQKMNQELKSLILINEQGMFKLAEKSTNLGRSVFLASILFFMITLFLAFLLADGLASRLAKPIKAMAAVLKDNKGLEQKLRLPTPDSLEMRILTNEVGSLWERVNNFKKINIEKISAERERLETVLSSVEDAILVLDNEGKIIQVSDGMLKVLELKLSEIIGYSWTDLSTLKENYLKLRERLNKNLQQDNSFELTINGKKQVYAARFRNIITNTGVIVGQVYLLHDITDIRHRERLRNEFIGVLSHELKTPIQSLGTAAELLSNRSSKMDEDSKMLIETINEDVSRIRSVANDFMQVSRVDLHSLKLKIEKIPLSQLLQEWIKPFRIQGRDKNVQIEFLKEGSEIIWAKADIVKLPWAISNLLANAIRVSAPNTKVVVSITDRCDMAQIEIRDEGPGIPESVQAKMFEPYYQAPQSESSTTSGFLGLGLTIAKEVVEAHQGQIEYFPRKPHGSIFRISIPYEIIYGEDI